MFPHSEWVHLITFKGILYSGEKINLKQFKVLIIVLLIIIILELTLVSYYHSSSNYEYVQDKQLNETNYIVIAKLPSFDSKTAVYLCGNGIYNLSIEIPENSSYFTVNKVDFNSTKITPHIDLFFNSTTDLSKLPALNLTTSFINNLSFFNPFSIKLVSRSQYPHLKTGLFNESGNEMLIISEKNAALIYYKEVSRWQTRPTELSMLRNLWNL